MNKHIYILFLVALFFFLQTSLIGQVAGYTFTSTTGTYTEITEGTVVAEATGTSGATGLDDVIYNIPEGTIPFPFYFNGTLYSGFNISTNGFITFGATSPTTTTYTPISSTLTYNGAASVVGRDLIGRFGFTADRTLGSDVLTNVSSFQGLQVGQLITGTGIATNTTITALNPGALTVTISQAATSTGTGATYVVPTGTIRYQTVGTAPNREFVIQWKRFSKFTGPNDEFNFQIRLHENNSAVEFVYGSMISNSTNASPQVGLRGAANTDFNNRTSTTDWTASTAGGTNAASMTLTNTVFPPNGLSYKFTPPNFPPSISYTPLQNTNQTGNRTFSANISDPDGIATGALTPRVYWKVNAGSWQSAATSSSSSPYSFTIGTTGLSVGDVVSYFVVAQDLLGAVGANPSAGFSATSVNDITTYPTTPNTYTIFPSITGTFTVGTGENYANLTQVANVLNNSVLTGNVVFELTNNYDGTTGETLPITFNQFSAESPSYTVTIRPASGVTGRVTSGDPGTGANLGIILFNGGDNYILDGRPGGVGSSIEWTLRNTRTAATIGCVIRFVDDATYNQIKYLNLESQATSTATGIIFFNTSTLTVGNSYNKIEYCNIRGRTDSPNPTSVGIYSSGTATALNKFNEIKNNHIANFLNTGISITATGNGPNWVISDNHFYNSVVSTVTQTGINVASATFTADITGNFIGGDGPNATGVWTNSGSVVVTGIAVTNGVVSINGNTIANFSQTGTGTASRLRGIYITSGNDGNEIINNNIYNLSTMSTGTGLGAATQPVWGIGVFTGSAFYKTNIKGNTIYNISADNNFANTTMNIPCGMFLTNVGLGSRVEGNKIYNIKNQATGTDAAQPPVAAGIYARFLDSAIVANNMITVGLGENTNTQFVGMMVVAGTVGNRVYTVYNSFNIDGTSSGNHKSFGFLRGDNSAVSPGSSIYLLNNIFLTSRSGGGSSNYAVGFQGADSSINVFSNYNVLYSVNANTIALSGTTDHTFTSWQTASGGDANSKSKIVFFANPLIGDLHLTGTSNGDNDLAGTPIAEVTIDFDGETRSATYPYMGADEAPLPIPVELALFSAQVDRRDVILSWSTATESGNYGFELERKIANSNEWVKVGFITGNGTTTEVSNYSFIDKGLASNKYNYRLKQMDYSGTYKYYNLSGEVEIGIPMEFNLSQNYPNPFNPETKINFDLPVDGIVTLKIYDITGAEVATVINEAYKAGYYTIQFNGSNLASGVYFFRLNAGNYVSTKKMILMK